CVAACTQTTGPGFRPAAIVRGRTIGVPSALSANFRTPRTFWPATARALPTSTAVFGSAAPAVRVRQRAADRPRTRTKSAPWPRMAGFYSRTVTLSMRRRPPTQERQGFFTAAVERRYAAGARARCGRTGGAAVTGLAVRTFL